MLLSIDSMLKVWVWGGDAQLVTDPDFVKLFQIWNSLMFMVTRDWPGGPGLNTNYYGGWSRGLQVKGLPVLQNKFTVNPGILVMNVVEIREGAEGVVW